MLKSRRLALGWDANELCANFFIQVLMHTRMLFGRACFIVFFDYGLNYLVPGVRRSLRHCHTWPIGTKPRRENSAQNFKRVGCVGWILCWFSPHVGFHYGRGGWFRHMVARKNGSQVHRQLQNWQFIESCCCKEVFTQELLKTLEWVWRDFCKHLFLKQTGFLFPKFIIIFETSFCSNLCFASELDFVENRVSFWSFEAKRVVVLEWDIDLIKHVPATPPVFFTRRHRKFIIDLLLISKYLCYSRESCR